MIKILIGVILFLFYLWVGTRLFYAAVNNIGGEEAYKKEIGSGVYVIALIAVIFFWPCFLISACLRR